MQNSKRRSQNYGFTPRKQRMREKTTIGLQANTRNSRDNQHTTETKILQVFIILKYINNFKAQYCPTLAKGSNDIPSKFEQLMFRIHIMSSFPNLIFA